MTPKERAEKRRQAVRDIEARNHAAGRHTTYVETCESCIAEKGRRSA